MPPGHIVKKVFRKAFPLRFILRKQCMITVSKDGEPLPSGDPHPCRFYSSNFFRQRCIDISFLHTPIPFQETAPFQGRRFLIPKEQKRADPQRISLSLAVSDTFHHYWFCNTRVMPVPCGTFMIIWADYCLSQNIRIAWLVKTAVPSPP